MNAATITFNKAAILRRAWAEFRRRNHPNMLCAPSYRTFSACLIDAWKRAKYALHIARKGARSDVESYLIIEGI